MDNRSVPSDATTDFGSEIQPRIAKTLPGAFVAPGPRGKERAGRI